MTDLRLFPLPDPVVSMVEAPKLSRDARRTHQQRVSLANGRHPATRRRVLDGWGFRCRDCVHAVRISNGHRGWWKCRRHRLGLSHSAESDIRISWPACDLLRIDAEEDR